MGFDITKITRSAPLVAKTADKSVEPILFRNVYVSYATLPGVTNWKKQSIRDFVNETFQGHSDAVLATSEQVMLKLNPHIKSIDQPVEKGEIKTVARTGFSIVSRWIRHSPTGPNNPSMQIDVSLARFGIRNVLVSMKKEQTYFSDRAAVLMRLPNQQFGELLKKEFGTPPQVRASEAEIVALTKEHARLSAQYPLNAAAKPNEEESRRFIVSLEDLIWKKPSP